jgi:riboflavin kinase
MHHTFVMLMARGGKLSGMSETRRAPGTAELTTLKELALAGALESEEKLSCAALGERLDASTQTASRRLQRLEEADLIERDIVNDGQWVNLTDDGTRRLQAEYADYRRLFEQDTSVTLVGTVTSGMGEGRHYITLPGYMEQFREKLGYEPFAGTLNVDLTEESVRDRTRLDAIEPITIEGWEDDERTYGPAYCYPTTLRTDTTYRPAHIIAPERTHHGSDQLEIIAPDRLRDELGLEDGQEVTLDVEQR